MGDENTGADDQKSAVEQGSTASDEKADQGQQDNGKPADQGNADDANKGEGGEKPKEEEKKPIEDDGKSEPAVRKRSAMTAKDHIIARKERQIEKARAAAAKPAEKPDDQGDGADDDADDDGVAPEDKELVSKIVDERLAPLVEERRKAEDDAEVREYLSANPEFAPFEAKVRRFMQHPTRKDVPASTIFLEVAGPDFLMQLGAEKARKAAEEAKKGGTGGSGSARDVSGGSKPVIEMTDDEFRAVQDKVRRGA